MNVIEIIVVLTIGCLISYITIRVWIAFWDSVINGIKRILGIKKKRINWHTIENTYETEKEIYIKKEHSDMNGKLY